MLIEFEAALIYPSSMYDENEYILKMKRAHALTSDMNDHIINEFNSPTDGRSAIKKNL